MGTVSELESRNKITHEIDGLKFVCYRVTAKIAFAAFGPNVLGIVGADAAPKAPKAKRTMEKKLQEMFEADRAGNMQRLLAEIMISPRLGDVDDDAADTVCWKTLGDYGERLFIAAMGPTQEAVRDFPESSEVQTG